MKPSIEGGRHGVFARNHISIYISTIINHGLPTFESSPPGPLGPPGPPGALGALGALGAAAAALRRAP